MKLPTLREVGIEARLLLIGIPVPIWTMVPIYHMFLFAISPKQDAFSGKLWPDHPTLHNFHIVFHQQHYFLRLGNFLAADDSPWELLMTTGFIYALPSAAKRYMVGGLTRAP